MGKVRQWHPWVAAAGPLVLVALFVGALSLPDSQGWPSELPWPVRLAPLYGWFLLVVAFMAWVGSVVRKRMAADERAARDAYGAKSAGQNPVLFRFPLGVRARRRALLSFTLAVVLVLIPALLPYEVGPLSFLPGCAIVLLLGSWICWTLVAVRPPGIGTDDLVDTEPLVGPPSPKRHRARRQVALAFAAAGLAGGAAKLAGADWQLTIQVAWNVLLLIGIFAVLIPMVRRVWRRDDARA